MLSCGRVGWQSWQVIIEYVPHSPAAIRMHRGYFDGCNEAAASFLFAEIKKLSRTKSWQKVGAAELLEAASATMTTTTTTTDCSVCAVCARWKYD